MHSKSALLLRNFTIANLILCKHVTSTSGAHFILKVSLFTLYLTGWTILKLEGIQWPKEGCCKAR